MSSSPSTAAALLHSVIVSMKCPIAVSQVPNSDLKYAELGLKVVAVVRVAVVLEDEETDAVIVRDDVGESVMLVVLVLVPDVDVVVVREDDTVVVELVAVAVVPEDETDDSVDLVVLVRGSDVTNRGNVLDVFEHAAFWVYVLRRCRSLVAC